MVLRREQSTPVYKESNVPIPLHAGFLIHGEVATPPYAPRLNEPSPGGVRLPGKLVPEAVSSSLKGHVLEMQARKLSHHQATPRSAEQRTSPHIEALINRARVLGEQARRRSPGSLAGSQSSPQIRSLAGSQSYHSSPRYTMVPRRPAIAQPIPGPGQYDTSRSSGQKAKGGTFGNAEVRRSLSPQRPRSASVDRTFCGSTSLRMASINRSRCADVEGAPGPGAYTPHRGAFGSEVASAWINSRIEVPVDDVPGPGAYGRGESLSPRTPRISFGSPSRSAGSGTRVTSLRASPREMQTTGAEIGPGRYSSMGLRAGPAYTMTPRRQAKTPDVPGPGAYLQAATSPRASYGRFNLAARAKELRENYLGPGSYDAAATDAGLAFSITRSVEKPAKSSPGPGSYELPRALFA